MSKMVFSPVIGMKSDHRVYFLLWRDAGIVKIGTTCNLRSRMQSIQGSMKDARLELLGTIPGSYAEKKSLHYKFRRGHAAREWFSYEMYGKEIGELIAAGDLFWSLL